jgi:hypothetical protein
MIPTIELSRKGNTIARIKTSVVSGMREQRHEQVRLRIF